MADRPENLLCRGRFPVQEFLLDEHLYRLFSSAQKVSGEFVAAAFRVPDLSVYRSCFCTSEEARFDRPDDGVLQIKVEKTTVDLTIADNRVCNIRPVHDPVGPGKKDPENYAHTEVRAYEGDKHLKEKWPKTLKTAFRLEVTRHFKEVHPAKTSEGSQFS